MYEEIIGEATVKWCIPSELRQTAEGLSPDPAVGAVRRRPGRPAAGSGLDTRVGSLVFRDVAACLDGRRIREEVLARVLGPEAVTRIPCVVRSRVAAVRCPESPKASFTIYLNHHEQYIFR